MYCPNCGQQQVSDEMRFCSRCGFQLSAVRDIIVSGGVPIERETAVSDHLSKAFRGMRTGVWVLLAALLLFLVFGFMAANDEDLAPLLLLPVLCFLIGFARLLYGAFIEGRWVKRDLSNVDSGKPAQLGTVGHSPELPPARTTPIRTFTAAKTQTAEMAQPPSVTESTTRLLDDETPSPRG